MKRKHLFMITAVIQALCLTACSSSAFETSKKNDDRNEKKAKAAEVQKETAPPETDPEPAQADILGETKEVVLYGTAYTIPAGWHVKERDETSTQIFFQDEDPKKNTDQLLIILNPGVLEEGTGYSDSEKCILKMRDDRAQSMFDKKAHEERYDRPETAGLFMDGEKSYYWIEVYIFMNSYNDAVQVKYYHTYGDKNDKYYTEEVRAVVDSMKFSYDGFK